MITAFSNRDGRVQQVTAPLRDAMWIDLLNATEAEGLAHKLAAHPRTATRHYRYPSV